MRPLLLCLALLALPGLGTGSPAAAASQGRIAEISLERAPCFGGCPVDKVVLRSDGTASYTGIRFVERMGQFTGVLPREQFQKLARLVEGQKYFSLRDRYAVSATDLPSMVVAVSRGGRRKTVVDYGNAGPLPLWTVQTAILGVAAGIRWQKDAESGEAGNGGASGIRGVAVQGPISPVQRPGQKSTRPLPDAVITVQPAGGGKEVARATADPEGRFKIPLPPGEYRIVPLPPTPGAALPRGEPRNVTVRANRFEEIEIRYDTGIR